MNVKIIKNLLKEIVYGDRILLLKESLSSANINWNDLSSLLAYNDLAPFLYVLLKKTLPKAPEEFLDFLKNSYYAQLLQYMTLHEKLLEIFKEAERKNILIIPLKGFSFAEIYYQRFGFRPLLDIDLLIKGSDFDKGVNLLEGLGYRRYLLGASEEYWLTKQCHLEFIKDNEYGPVLAELHFALDFKRYKSEVMPQLWNRLRKINTEGQDLLTMSPEDTLFSLALHQRRFGKVFNLKYVCDAGIILSKESLDWDYILKTAHEERIRASLYFLLYQVQLALDKDIQRYLDKLKIPYWQKKMISVITKAQLYSPSNTYRFPYIYAFCHFLFYEGIAYPIKYILNIPPEQFAKFYSLPLNSKKTLIKYKMRFLYIVYRLAKDSLRKFLEKLSV